MVWGGVGSALTNARVKEQRGQLQRRDNAILVIVLVVLVLVLVAVARWRWWRWWCWRRRRLSLSWSWPWSWWGGCFCGSGCCCWLLAVGCFCRFSDIQHMLPGAVCEHVAQCFRHKGRDLHFDVTCNPDRSRGDEKREKARAKAKAKEKTRAKARAKAKAGPRNLAVFLQILFWPLRLRKVQAWKIQGQGKVMQSKSWCSALRRVSRVS